MPDRLGEVAIWNDYADEVLSFIRDERQDLNFRRDTTHNSTAG